MRGWCSEVDGSSNKQNRRKRCAKDRHALQGMYYLHNRLTHQAQCLQEWHEVSSNALCNSTQNVGLNAKIRKVEGKKRACITLLSIVIVCSSCQLSSTPRMKSQGLYVLSRMRARSTWWKQRVDFKNSICPAHLSICSANTSYRQQSRCQHCWHA